jgi:hypothetical protein
VDQGSGWNWLLKKTEAENLVTKVVEYVNYQASGKGVIWFILGVYRDNLTKKLVI